MSYRSNTKNVLETYLSNPKNIDIIEKCLFFYNSTREEYFRTLYEVIEMISKKIKLKVIIDNIKKSNIGIFSNDFQNIHDKIKEEESFIIKPFEIEEGVLECGKCGSKKTYSYTKQTRSGDESTTVFAVCYKCNNRWKI